MYEESSLELAENKLLLLYILKTLRQPISNTQLTEIVLENSFINYFTLQQYVNELEEAQFIEYSEVMDKNYTLHKKVIMYYHFLKTEYLRLRFHLLMNILSPTCFST